MPKQNWLGCVSPRCSAVGSSYPSSLHCLSCHSSFPANSAPGRTPQVFSKVKLHKGLSEPNLVCPKAQFKSLPVWAATAYITPHPLCAATSKQTLVWFIRRLKLKGTEPTSLYYDTSCCSRSLIFNFQKYVKVLDLKNLISLNLRQEGWRLQPHKRKGPLYFSLYLCLGSARAQNIWNNHCSNSLVFFTQLLLHKSRSSLPVDSAHFATCRLPRKPKCSVFFKQERISLLWCTLKRATII